MEAAAKTDIKDLAKRLAPIAAIGGAAVANATGLLNFDLPQWMIDLLKQWGPAAVLLVGVAYYLPRNVVRDFIVAHQNQAVAMGKIGDQLQVLTGQSGKLDEIKTMIGESSLTQRVIVDRLSRIEVKLEINDVARTDHS